MYSVEERQIFKFWDGEKDRMVDPLAIYRKLGSLNSDLQADIAKARPATLKRCRESSR